MARKTEREILLENDRKLKNKNNDTTLATLSVAVADERLQFNRMNECKRIKMLESRSNKGDDNNVLFLFLKILLLHTYITTESCLLFGIY